MSLTNFRTTESGASPKLIVEVSGNSYLIVIPTGNEAVLFLAVPSGPAR